MSTNYEKSQLPDLWYLNPKTNRYCRVGSNLHKKLTADTPIVETTPLKVGLVNLGAEVIEEHISDLMGVTNDPKELDRMLKRLLIAKLCPAKSKAKKHKKKYRVVTPSPSSDSESESSD